MAKIADISVEEVEHYFTKARKLLDSLRQSHDETDHRYWLVQFGDALEALNHAESSIVKAMGFGDYDPGRDQ